MEYIFVITTVITFIIFGMDKYRAVRHKRRISEAFLLAVTFLGGTAGALLGMLIFRHKVSKKSFLFKLAVVIMIQCIMTGIIFRQSGNIFYHS
ncbi:MULTISPECIES: DUF1294 domain-containing protein [Chryseobacterium]|uniref:Uncharacterized membrane protein YsdA (DUF1294 family) n=1 Tax=Chryseobacterium camelliae TaxID=1265445 RepID=A0ABU0THF5_9FLAO|nr:MULTISPECIES: DUF1294 domain-containing protein [Chryseobacterium]MDQ1096482.1 uncharacterized membrane protein YsdA (DUF1294 family) [Chryseobacterium camelliae]MDQ1100422.1 uncharacterized membrane protein YsdA (DUF1294 family) [Chryseobacterium sp. SORGH_AS_1048]MDR6087763.1 uncharacterized membrane protein YsdA (DUF1294 family) [Chryseobacterium sp. SORGH_AS_0909]MDR6132139.1 uncharacterized membrane protein YsdA (DUF1294 family) [Chryseobacterium sp. SORGH_AS_1175]